MAFELANDLDVAHVLGLDASAAVERTDRPPPRVLARPPRREPATEAPPYPDAVLMPGVVRLTVGHT